MAASLLWQRLKQSTTLIDPRLQTHSLIDYRVLPTEELLIVYQSGEPQLDEVHAMRLSMREDPDFTLTYDVIVDVSDLTAHFRLEDMQSLVDSRLEEQKFSQKLAIITGNRDLTFAVHRQYAAIADARNGAPETKVCRSREEALTWLKRPDLDLETIIRDIITQYPVDPSAS